MKKEETEITKNNEEDLLNSDKIVPIESIKGLFNFYPESMVTEEKYMNINNFPSEALEKTTFNYDYFENNEEILSYKFNRVMGQSTRGYWNKYKEAVEAQLAEEEVAVKEDDENNDSDDEEAQNKE